MSMNDTSERCSSIQDLIIARERDRRLEIFSSVVITLVGLLIFYIAVPAGFEMLARVVGTMMGLGIAFFGLGWLVDAWQSQ